MPASPTGTTDDTAEADPSPGLRRVVPALLMLLVVGVAAGLPLFRNTIFYYWDDTAAAAVPAWRRMAEAVLSGEFPLLNLDMWRGGNFAAEAATGMWNPVVLLLAVSTYAIDNMALAMTVCKTVFMGIMAGGSYLLAREYGVGRNLSAVAGAALPLAGYSFFMDATSWINALMLTAFIPWVWWTGRRALHRGGSLVWLVVAGYLCCSLGNPYSLLATAILFLALLVEAWFTGRRNRLVGLTVAGAAVLTLVVMVYLPLLMTTSVGVRANARTRNDEFFAPNLSNMLTLSTPTAQPYVRSFGRPYLTFPGLYLAWFVLPLVPWLQWRTLRAKWRELTGLLVFGAVSGLLVLGPSQVWMFRWPLRLIDFLWFPVLLLWMVAASVGLARTRTRLRATLSFLLVALGGYLGWADLPNNRNQLVIGCLVVAGLVALVLWRGLLTRSGLAVLLSGTLLVLAVQLYYYPRNDNVANYQMPTSQSLLKEQFAKYDGLTVQLVSTAELELADRVPDRIYTDALFGAMYAVTGVESTTSYTGIGFTKLDQALCMRYQGSTCPQAWDTLWQRPDGYPVPMADLLRARTVVVQNSLVDTRGEPAPDGWRRAPEAETSGLVTVYKRVDPLPFGSGRVSHVTTGIQVDADQLAGNTEERVLFQRTGQGTPAAITFARLAWPGYTATVNGEPVAVRTGPYGLAVVDLPTGVAEGELRLSWQPPGRTISLAAFTIGALLTIGLVVAPWLRRRRSPSEPAGTGHPPAGPDPGAGSESRPEPGDGHGEKSVPQPVASTPGQSGGDNT